MNENVFYSAFFCHFEQREQMRYMTVNAAGRQQSVQMKFFARILRTVHSGNEFFVFKEVAVLNSLGDTG